MKIKYILPILLVLPVLSACNQSDDVLDIFTGKTWKLTSIFYDKGNKQEVCLDYWTTETAREASMDLLAEKGNFTINFTGAEIEDDVVGTYSGRASRGAIEGRWRANGKNNTFTVSEQSGPGGQEDILGRAFINGLINASKYDGDTNGNLRIYFEDPDRKDKRFFLFHINN